ncbi:MAG: molybdopterin molybdotransferase MoeA [Gammaproteobacteria bacterium]|nr:molybdopterin molybdotransferase MoeA [Gammaproteobacteria bacterium]MBT7236583.1 molybdopterin molybdotransferase MoeA [Gammaproteobacteria bacterium]
MKPMNKNTKNSCINDFDPSALDEVTAVKQILKSIAKIKESETINIMDSLGRVSSKNIKSSIDIPSFRNSAMDGYAVNIKNLEKNEYTLVEQGISLAGQPYIKKLKNQGTVRVMTGAVIPDNSDAVIMKEMTDLKDNMISFPKLMQKNQNIRNIGEDIKKGATVIKKGRQINYVDLGILSSLGIAKIDVVRKPVVSFFSTGDELVSINQKLKKGQIYDSNRYLLFGLLNELPVQIKDMGVVKDDERILVKKLQECSKISDIVITTGGVSVGDADYIKSALKVVGKVNFWKIAIKPGRPLAYGKINNASFFGLPGNPVSAAVTFQIFIIPAIRRMLQMTTSSKLTLNAIVKSNLSKKKGRVEYKRGLLEQKDGVYIVNTTGLQGSNILSSLSKANCYIRLSSETNNINKGDIVEVIPFNINL